MVGGSGAMTPNGHDVVVDFTPVTDKLVVEGFNITDAAAFFEQVTISDDDSGNTIVSDAGARLKLLGVPYVSLNPDDWVFNEPLFHWERYYFAADGKRMKQVRQLARQAADTALGA